MEVVLKRKFLNDEKLRSLPCEITRVKLSYLLEIAIHNIPKKTRKCPPTLGMQKACNNSQLYYFEQQSKYNKKAIIAFAVIAFIAPLPESNWKVTSHEGKALNNYYSQPFAEHRHTKQTIVDK